MKDILLESARYSKLACFKIDHPMNGNDPKINSLRPSDAYMCQ